MSGRKQHYIPKLLLRGFLMRSKGSMEYVQVYRKGGKSYTSELSGVGAARDFYSPKAENGEVRLDDLITRHESRLAEQVAELRAIQPGSNVPAVLGSELATHLAQRTASVREIFWQAFQALGSSVKDFAQDRASLGRLIGLEEEDRDGLLHSKIREQVRERAEFQTLVALGFPTTHVERMLVFLAREKSDDLFEAAEKAIETSFQYLAEELPASAKIGHNKALTETLGEGGVREELLKYSWLIRASEQGTFILPDCVAIAISADGAVSPFMMDKAAERRAILLPISSRSMLIGLRDIKDEPDLKSFNDWAAQCSNDFFAASENTTDLKTLSNHIGSVPESFVEQTVADAIATIGKTGEPNEPAGNALPPPPALDGYQLSFDGIQDESAHQIAAVIKHIIGREQDVFRLSRLDGITFSHDYPGALQQLDRGRSSLSQPQTVSEDIGIGLAQAPLIIKDDRVAVRIIARADVGLALLSEDQTAIGFALHILVSELAYVDLIETIDTCCPGFLMHPYENRHDGDLNRFVFPAISTYFCSRSSTGFGIDKDIDKWNKERAVDAIERYARVVPDARDAYQHDHDVPKLFDAACSVSGELLTALAAYHGHRDGTRTEDPMDPDLATFLSDHELVDWYERYGAELRRLWNDHGRWKDPARFIALNIHLERLLWRHSLFVWDTGDGGYLKVLPSASDIAALG